MTAWIVCGVALAAAGLALALLLLRERRRDAPLGEAAAVQTAEAALPGFTAVAALVGDDRRAALVVGEHARVALVVGGRVPRAQEVRWGEIRAVAAGLSVAAGGRRQTLIPGITVLDVRRAGGDAMRPERAG